MGRFTHDERRRIVLARELEAHVQPCLWIRTASNLVGGEVRLWAEIQSTLRTRPPSMRRAAPLMAEESGLLT